MQKAKECDNNVLIDIEDNSYVDNTIMFYKKMKLNFDNVGLCLQAYLYRTKDDIMEMMDIDPCIRLVKGAYNEPDTVAFKYKAEVDDNFFKLSKYKDFLLDLYKKHPEFILPKSKRKEATYSSIYKFDKDNVEELRLKSISLINKIKEILTNN